MNRSLIHKFQTDDNKYIFDAVTNQIAQVDEVVYEIVDDYGALNPEALSAKYGPKWGCDMIWKRLEAIEKMFPCRDLPLSPSAKEKVPIDSRMVKERISSKLRQITLSITEECNFRCSYCVYSGKHAGRRTHSCKKMTWNVAHQAINCLLEHSKNLEGPVALGFYGGEPLLRFDFIRKCVEEFKNKSTHPDKTIVAITSNGSIMNRDILQFLVDHNVALSISIDGPQYIHDQHRKFKSTKMGSFFKIMDTLDQLRSYNVDYFENCLWLNLTLVPPVDYRLLDDFFCSVGLPVRINLVQGFDAGRDSNKSLEKTRFSGYKEIEEKFVQAAINGSLNKRRARGEYLFVKNFFETSIARIHLRPVGLRPENHRLGGLCVPGADKIFVNTDGTFYVCEQVEGNKNMCIGDVWNGVDVNRVLAMISKYHALGCDDCYHCWLNGICHICFSHVVSDGAYDEKMRRENCLNIRNTYHRLLTVYCSVMEKNPEAFDYMEKFVLSQGQI